MKTKIIFIFLILLNAMSYAQTKEYGVRLRESVPNENISYEIFKKEKPKEFKHLRNLSEVDNSSLLGYLTSWWSENTLEWYAYNRGLTIAEAKPDSGYIEEKRNEKYNGVWESPNMIINYEKESQKSSFLKFYVGNQKMDTIVTIKTQIKYKDGRWIQMPSGLTGFDFLFSNINPHTLAALIEGKPTKSAILNEAIANTRNKFGGLDEIKLNNEFNSWQKQPEKWSAFTEPFSMVNKSVPNPAPDPIPKKGKGLTMTSHKDFGGICLSTLGSDTLHFDKKGYHYPFLKLGFSAITPEIQNSMLLTPNDKFAAKIFNETKLENLRHINSFGTANYPNLNSKDYTITRIKDIQSGKYYILKMGFRYAPEKDPKHKVFKGGKFYFAEDKYFEDIDWLFENLKPEVFHETISYKFNEDKPYPYAELEPELSRLITKEFIPGPALSLEGLRMLFEKLKKDKKYAWCFN